jgi:hypothetical protein
VTLKTSLAAGNSVGTLKKWCTPSVALHDETT